MEINGQALPVKSIRNLNGHDIVQYSIHGGKSVPIIKSNDQTKMEENEIFAIETFGSTGKGYVRDDVRCAVTARLIRGYTGTDIEQMETSHYAKRADAPNVALRVSSARSLLKTITKNFGTLPFCRRYLDRLGHDKYLLGVSSSS